MTTLAACIVLAGAALMALRRRKAARRRVRNVLGAAPIRRSRRIDRIRWTSAAAGLAAALLVDGVPGVVTGVVVGLVLDRVLRRLESRASREARLGAAAELPFAIDLLAASLRAGSPPAVAAGCVGTALGGPLGERLCRVAYGLGLGAAPADAWSHLHGVPGAERLTAAAVRSSQSGAALAGAFVRLADELRTAREMACEAAARRAGVLVVLPLGLCFLPAFVLAGLVPIVLSVLGRVVP